MRVLIVVSACLAATLAVPAGLAPAGATGAPALRVITLDRHGRAVAGQVEIANIGDGRSYVLTGGRYQRVERGTYEVLAEIPDHADGSDTAGTALATVSGRTSVTIDARRGRRVGARLAPAPVGAYDQFLSANVCVHNAMISAGGRPGSLFVIASRRNREELAVASQWEPVLAARSRPVFLATWRYRGGIPAGVSATYRQSSLTTMTVSGRSGAEFGEVALTATAPAADDPCSSQPRNLRTNLTLPYTVTLRVPAGRWELWQDGTSHLFGPPHTYERGHAYRVTVGAATWGPDGNLPYTDQYSHELIYQNLGAFADPELPAGGEARVEYRLTHAGHVLVHRTFGPGAMTVPAKIPGAGWYGLTARATRVTTASLPAGALSVHATVHLHFYADPTRTAQVRAFLTRFRPAALDAENRATARTTTVWLKPFRVSTIGEGAPVLRDRVRRIRAWASGDGGHTWRAVRVVRDGARWRASVPNPHSGYVALRATVDDTHGGTATTTVYRAYAIG